MKKIKIERHNEGTGQEEVVSLMSHHLPFMQESREERFLDIGDNEEDDASLGQQQQQADTGKEFNLSADDCRRVDRPSDELKNDRLNCDDNHDQFELGAGSSNGSASEGGCSREASPSSASQSFRAKGPKIKVDSEEQLREQQPPLPASNQVSQQDLQANKTSSQADFEQVAGQVQQFFQHQQQQQQQQQQQLSPLGLSKAGSKSNNSSGNQVSGPTSAAIANEQANNQNLGSSNNNSGNDQSTLLPATPTGPAAPGTPANFCHLCKKELCNKYFMKTHMQKMHGINLDEYPREAANSGGVVCDICQKELCSKYFLKVHKSNTHGITDFNSGSAGSQAANAATAVAAIALTNYSLNNAQKRAALNLALSQHQLQNRQAAALMNAAAASAAAFNPLQAMEHQTNQKQKQQPAAHRQHQHQQQQQQQLQQQLQQQQHQQHPQQEHLSQASSLISQLQQQQQHHHHHQQQQQLLRQQHSQGENLSNGQQQNRHHQQQHHHQRQQLHQQSQQAQAALSQTNAPNGLAGSAAIQFQSAFPAAALLAATTNNPLLAAQLAAQQHQQNQQRNHHQQQQQQPGQQQAAFNFAPPRYNHEQQQQQLDQDDTDADDASDRDSLTDLTNEHQRQQLLLNQQHQQQQQHQLLSNQIAAQLSQINPNNHPVFPNLAPDMADSEPEDVSDHDSLIEHQIGAPVANGDQQQQMKDRLSLGEFNQQLQQSQQQQAFLNAMVFNPTAAAAAMMAMQQQHLQQHSKQALANLAGAQNSQPIGSSGSLNMSAHPTSLASSQMTHLQRTQMTLPAPSSTGAALPTSATATTASSRGQAGNNSRYLRHYTEACPICDRRFKSIKWLQSHVMNDHKNEISNLFNLLVQILLCSNASNSTGAAGIGVDTSDHQGQQQMVNPTAASLQHLLPLALPPTSRSQRQATPPHLQPPVAPQAPLVSPQQLQQQPAKGLGPARNQMAAPPSSRSPTRSSPTSLLSVQNNPTTLTNASDILGANLSSLAAIGGLNLAALAGSQIPEPPASSAFLGIDLRQQQQQQNHQHHYHQQGQQFQATSLLPQLSSKPSATPTTANRE